ncbi:unnamed protein product [Orchesella dallaii]|uniref:Uncharacterized protein n=1 Tax=Orchesella dallaii TaxID=48710 RepID=A0ABP1Q2H8_9HEXA
MRQIKIFIVALTCIAASSLLPSAYGQIEARNTVPDTITGCYLNNTAYNRFARQPMHINNLITIIRKIEMKTDGQWDIRRIARTLVHRYTFDGMEFNPASKPEFQYRQKPVERAKTLILKSLIPIPAEEILPDYILDNDEKCALHWMLSHSMNATVRDEELNPYGNNPSYGSPSYPNSGGSNPYGTNNNQQPNNQNTGSNYYRGRRDVSENETSEESSEEDGVGQNEVDTESPNVENVNPKQAASNNLDYQEDISDSSENDPDNYDTDKNISETASATDVQEEPEKSSSNQDSLSNLPQDTDDDVEILLPESRASSGSSSKSARQVSTNKPGRTRRPIETGVVYTDWGSISAGRLIAGIAAGLEPVTMSVGGNTYSPESSYGGTNPWSSGSGVGGNNNNNNGGYGNNYPMKSVNNQPQYPTNTNGQQPQSSSQWRGGRKRRQAQNLQPIESLYAATLAGDVGQAAVLNAIYQISSAIPPRGEFNDTVCPREYILQQHPDPTKEIFMDSASWSYMTEAEIRGGLDGLIIGSNIRRWSPSYTIRLSDVLSQYYSEEGVIITGEQNFRSCDRSSLYSTSIGNANLEEQARSFATLYSNRTNGMSDQNPNPNTFNSIVQEATQRMLGVMSSFSSIDKPCTRRNSAGDQNDNQKYIVPKLTVYGVLDHSATVLEIDQQKRFLGQLAHEILVSPQGSRLGVVDGNSGSILISPNWTDTSSILACAVLGIPSISKTQDYNRVMTNLKTEIERVKNEEQRTNYTNDNGIVILLMVQGKQLEDTQRTDIIRIREEINSQFEDIAVIAASNKYQESDFQDIDFIRLSNAQNFSDDAASFAQDLLKKTHGVLRYVTCNAFIHSQENEHLQYIDLFISPGDIQYYKITPNFFFSARTLMLRFTSDNGRVRVCQSRIDPFPNSSNQGTNGVSCQETKGTWIAPGKTEIDIQYEYQQPCGKHGKYEGCGPIFISITPISTPTTGTGGLDCTVEGCQSSNQVKVTYTHWGMRCNGAMKTALSSTFAILTVLLSLMNWFKSV